MENHSELIIEVADEYESLKTFESGNAQMEDLKDKIQEMFSHHFDYESIAKNAIERYSSEAYYEKLMKIYQG